MKLENIEFLITSGGEITVGRIGPVSCAATASDGNMCLALLQRKPDESLLDFLQRLDTAVENAWENEVYVDELNAS